MSWPTKPLGEVADCVLGKMLDQKKNKGEPLPYLANVNVRWGEFDLESLREMRFEPHEMERYGVQDGDIVMCEGGEPGRCAIWKEQLSNMMIQKAIHRIRPHEGLNNRFLYYSFLLKGRTGAFSPLFTGATIKHLPGQNLKKVEVEVPPITTQKAIADILSAYDDLIENNRRRMALLEESARLLYREWFVHLRFPGHEHVPITDGVPEGWEKTTLSQFIESEEISLQTGPFGTQLKASDYAETGTPVINVRNIGYGSIRPEKLEFLPDMKAELLAKHRLDSGDIVFGRKGAVDRHVLIGPNEEGWMQGSDCIRLRVEKDERLSPVLLSIAFREETHKQWMLGQCGNKATMASLNQDVIARIPVVVPSAETHKMFSDLAEGIVRQIAVLKREADAAAEARDTLLPRIMNGELVV